TLMPSLRGTAVRVKYIVGRTGGASAQHVAQKFSVPFATTDLDSVLDDAEVQAVMITTNHDSHASLARPALDAGKHVFVEKPLALTDRRVAQVMQTASEHSDRRLFVGLNRRFSPHVERCRQLLAGRAAPLAINMLINAGEIPPEHWVHDARVGG